MANLYWMNPNTGDTAFTLEFDESVVESEFSELVYGLIENANGDAHRQNETIASQRECIKSLRDELLLSMDRDILHSKEINQLKAMLDDISTGKMVPLESDVEYGLPNTEYNNMGEKIYNNDLVI